MQGVGDCWVGLPQQAMVVARIGLQGVTEPIPVKTSGVPTWTPGKSYEGTFTSTLAPANIADSAFAGATMEVGLSYLVGGNSQNRYSWAQSPIACYKSAPKIVPETGSVADFPATVWLDLPPAFDTDFRDLMKQKGIFAAAIDGHAAYALTVTADWTHRRGKVRLDLVLSDKKASVAQKNEFVKAWCEGDLTIALSIPSDAGPDLPTVDPATVTLKQRTAGCPTG